MKRNQIKDIHLAKPIDVRPLDQRSGKRIKPGQTPDAKEQLFFMDPVSPLNEMPTGSDEPDLEIQSMIPDYIRRRIRENY